MRSFGNEGFVAFEAGPGTLGVFVGHGFLITVHFLPSTVGLVHFYYPGTLQFRIAARILWCYCILGVAPGSAYEWHLLRRRIWLVRLK